MNEKQLSQSEQEYKYQWYLDRVSEKREWAEKLAESQDKLVFALSTGALILSVNFIGNLVEVYRISSLNLLKISWILLVSSSTLVLISMWSAGASTLADKKTLDSWFKNNSFEVPDFRHTWKHKLTAITDILSKLFLILLT